MSVFRTTIRLGGRPAVVALFVIALQVSLGERADASCGDWLAHEGMPTQNQEPAAADEPRDVPSPCSSGQCRQAPHQPLPVSPPRSVTPQLDQWATLADAGLTPCSAKRRSSLEVPLNFPEGYRSPLERPPRV
jgi:hypothetical protein